jgi:tetratricopeptide (TPR) repeat protein
MKSYERGRIPSLIRACQRSLAVRMSLMAAPLVAVLFVVVTALLWGRGEDRGLKSAIEAWNSGDYETAAEEYEDFLRRNPDGTEAMEARFQLANVYYLNLSRYDLAFAHYSRFLEQSPSGDNAYTARERLAEVLGEMGRSYEAIAEYEQLNPEDAGERRRIRLRIADLYYDQTNYSQALAEYEKVIEGGVFDEVNERALLRQASIHHIKREQYREALPIYQKLASLSTDADTRRRAVYGIADCYAGLFQFDEAIAALKQVTDPNEQAYVSKRVAELEQKRHEASLARSKLEQSRQ